MYKLTVSSVVAILLATGLLLIATGCGGGNSGGPTTGTNGTGTISSNGSVSTTRGVLRIGVKWPASRAITRSALSVANSMVIMVKQDEGYNQTVVVNRSSETGIAEFTDVPVGTVQISGTAYTGTDGSGTASGTGTATAGVVSGTAVDVPLTFSATKPTGTPATTTGSLIIYAVDSEDSPSTLPSPSPSPSPSATPTPTPSPSPTPEPQETLMEAWLEPNKSLYRRGDSVRIVFQLSSKKDLHMLESETVQVRAFWFGGPTEGKLLDSVRVQGQSASVSYQVPNDLTQGIYIVVLFRGGTAYKPSYAQLPIPIER